MEQYKVDLNKAYAEDYKMRLGYGPNPACPKCGGFGWTHPLNYNGSRNYSEVIPCNARGCMRETFNNKVL